MMFEVITCPMTLQQIHVRDMGRQFSALILGPFLLSGVTIAFRQSSGTFPSRSELLSMSVSMGAISSQET